MDDFLSEKEKYAFEDQSVHLNNLLKFIFSKGGTDLHVSTGSQAIIRVMGTLVTVDTGKFTEKTVRGLIFPRMLGDQIDELYRRRFVSFPLRYPEFGQCQVKVYFEGQGMAFSVRLTGTKPRSLRDIGFPEVLYHECRKDEGLILLTGPGRSGLATTTAALVKAYSTSLRRHVVLIEESQSGPFESGVCKISQMVKGRHFSCFSDGINHALQIDADILVIKGIKEAADIEAMVEALERGLLVVATANSEDGIGALQKWVNLVAPERRSYIQSMLAHHLRMMSSQELRYNKRANKITCHFAVVKVDSKDRNAIRLGEFSQARGKQKGISGSEDISDESGSEEETGFGGDVPNMIHQFDLSEIGKDVYDEDIEDSIVQKLTVLGTDSLDSYQSELTDGGDEASTSAGDIELTGVRETEEPEEVQGAEDKESLKKKSGKEKRLKKDRRAKSRRGPDDDELEGIEKVRPEPEVTQVKGGIEEDRLDKILDKIKAPKKSS